MMFITTRPSSSSSSSSSALTLILALLALAHSVVLGEFLSTDYDVYNAGELGHRPYHTFYSSSETAPVLQVNTWNRTGDASGGGSHIFLRNDGQHGDSPSSPLVLDASDLSAVYVNRSFAHVFGPRVQEDRGRRYLTFWAGARADGISNGFGLAYDENYRLVYNVSARADLGINGDLHEFQFTGRGTALVIGVDHINVDTSGWKGWRYAKKFWILDEVFQEVDLVTNEVLFSWRLRDHITPMDSFEKPYVDWDVYHMNSIEKTEAGNYLISIRHTHSIYLIDGKTGAILWTLGGKGNTFKELATPDGLPRPSASLLSMAWQHHARWVPGTGETEMTVFDNRNKETTHGECTAEAGTCSRALHVRLDTTASPPTAQILREYLHPARLQAQSQGSVQPLGGDGNGGFDRVFIGWGRCPTFTEHDAATGEVLLDVQFSPWHSEEVPDALDNYRAFRQDWVGMPWWNPAVQLRDGEGGTLEVYVSWNGATEVREWVVKGLVGRQLRVRMDDDEDEGGGDMSESLEVMARSRRTGFETMMTVSPFGLRYLWVEALDAQGKILGRTEILDFEKANVTILPYESQGGPVVTVLKRKWPLLAGVAAGIVLFVMGGRVFWQRCARDYNPLEAEDFDDEVGSDLDIESVLELDLFDDDAGHEAWRDYSPKLAVR